MGRINETISTVNSAARTALAVAILGVLSATGYIAYDRVTSADRALAEAKEQAAASQQQLVAAEATISGLRVEVAEQEQQIVRLETAMKLLKTDQRLAQIEVTDQSADPETGRTTTTLRFTELSPEGNPISPAREFEIQGEIVYLDNWVVKFDDQYVEAADLERGTSLALFRRIFGEFETPADGQLIDEVGVMPQAYQRGGMPSDFEKEIWDDFWTFANDPSAAKEKGIRAAHGEALSMKMEAGRKYRVVLRASDGLSIIPEPLKPAGTGADSNPE